MAKYFIGGYEVSSETRLEYDRQQARNRIEEAREQEQRQRHKEIM